jgi:serine/threonine protein kinase
MNLSTECLQASQVDSLLQGNLTPEEYESAQDHLELCESCRARVEATIGPEQWWSDVQSVLLNSRTRSSSQRNATSSDAEPNEPSAAKLLDLLGPTDDPNMLGRIGPYEIIGLLGQGGMGAVFKGFDRSLNRFVAIKMLLPHLAASGAARKRFAREGQAVAAVVDDHVMAIHCVDEWQGVPYLVMTYSRGVSLQKRLSDNGPLEVREILRIGMQAAKGLAAAHAQGIVHRDIKPANIFLDQNVERVQLMDFGLARAVDDASLTRSGTLAGTPQYMSPEQARAETVDHRSDLFSLGSVMYAMCTGHAPFRAESSYSVLRLITDKESRPIREINPDVPEWLCEIISKLMAKQADDRFTSAQDVAELLEDCLAHVQQPTSSPLPASLVPHVATVRRSVSNVTRTGVMTMLGTLGISLLGMFLWQATDPPDISGQWTSDEWGTVVLKAKEPGQYEGTFNGSEKVGPANDGENNISNKVPEGASETSTPRSAVGAIPPGKLHLKWSAIERRFNGNWGTGDDTKGKISLRLVDNEIRGACTSTNDSRKESTSPQLTDLLWKRSGGTSTSIIAAAEKEYQSTMPAESGTFLDRLQGTWRTKGEPMCVWEVFATGINETVFDEMGNVRSEEWLISDEGNLDNLASPARIKLMAKDRTTGSFPLGGAITQRCLLAVDGDSLVCCTGADYPNEIAKRPGQFVREFRRDKENPLELRGDWIVDDWDRGSGDDAILKSNDIDFPRYSLRFHPDRFCLRALNDKYVESPDQRMVGFRDVRQFQWSIPGESQPGEFLLTVQSGNKTQLLYGRYQSMHTPPRTKPDRLRLTISRKPLTGDSPSASDWHFECHRARTEIEREQKLEALPESQSNAIAARTLNVHDPRSVVLEFLHRALHKQYRRAAELCSDKLVDDGLSVSDDVENEFYPYRSVRRLSLKSLYIDLESEPKAALFFTRRETLSDWDRPVCLAIHLTRTEHGWVITRCESVDEQQEQEILKAFVAEHEADSFDLWEDDDLNPNSQWSEFSRKNLSPGSAK